MIERTILIQEVQDCWNRIGVRGDQSCEKLRDHLHCRNCDVHSDAARNITERAVPPGYQQEWARHFAEEERTVRVTDRSALIFRIGAEWLALPTRLSLTIVDKVGTHRVPHRTNKVLLGIANIKGKLYPCMSLGALLQLDMQEPPAQPGRRIYPRTLLMQMGGHAFALPVDDLHGIHRYAEAELQSPPSTSNKAMHRYLTGVLSIGHRRIGCLDAELVGYNLANGLK